ncbi:MAG: hypothetical protein WC829_07660 [Hyphomicrobium sp.]|jgi:hypothetical protein
MRTFIASTLIIGLALAASASAADAGRSYRSARQSDCVPTNGPYGFYGNLWCQPPSEAQYMRNLGAQWPMKTPPSLRNPKPSSNYGW